MTNDQAVTPMPRGWISLALLLWGGFTEAWASAIVMALLIEAIAFSPVKWAMQRREFHRAADLTTVLFALVTALQFSRYGVRGIYEILSVTPYCFFPLLLAQRASTRQTIPMSALFYSLRRDPEQDSRLDIAPHYIVVCILAASTNAPRGTMFIVLTALIVCGLLAAARPRRYPLWQWCGALLAALALAAATGYGVIRAQHALEASFMYWLDQFPWASGDPNRAYTAIGTIGRLKLSDQIRVRVTPGPQVSLPLLLQEATYDEFRFGTWAAREADFAALDKLAGRQSWALAGAAAGSTTGKPLEITFQHRRELALLPLPRGTHTVTSDEISELQRNRFGTVMSESPPGALRYLAASGATASLEPPPNERDARIPESYQDVISRTAQEIGIVAGDDAGNAQRIRDFFHDNFRYSLVQRGGFGWRTPLAHFLEKTRRGHCEYFATAAVMLLREAGIPARYAVGYVVENYSELENAYIARARHAHAWALAWVDGTWITVDATPAVWYGLENARASAWQSVQDVGAWLWYRFQRLSQADLSEFSDWLVWLVPPLAVVLYLRLRKSPLAVRKEEPVDAVDDDVSGPLDEVLARLEARGLSLQPGETMAHFLRRARPLLGGPAPVAEVIEHYYRLRFAPAGAGGSVRERLRAALRRLGDASAGRT